MLNNAPEPWLEIPHSYNLWPLVSSADTLWSWSNLTGLLNVVLISTIKDNEFHHCLQIRALAFFSFLISISTFSHPVLSTLPCIFLQCSESISCFPWQSSTLSLEPACQEIFPYHGYLTMLTLRWLLGPSYSKTESGAQALSAFILSSASPHLFLPILVGAQRMRC